MHNLWKWIGAILFLIALLATAGIYTLYPAASVVFVVQAGLGGFLFARHRGRS